MNKSYYTPQAPRTRIPGLLLAAGLHVGLIAVVWNYRAPIAPPSAGAPIMVSFITAEPELAKPIVIRVEPVKPKPKPRPEKVVLSTTTPVASAFETAPPPEPEPVTPPSGPKAEPAPIIEPYADPSYLNNEAKYPANALRARKQGTPRLLVLVTAQGTVGAAKLESSSGHRELDEAALESVKTFKFRPAMQGNKAIDYWTIVPINYSISSKSKG